VDILQDGTIIGKGIINYSHSDTIGIIGEKSSEITRFLDSATVMYGKAREYRFL